MVTKDPTRNLGSLLRSALPNGFQIRRSLPVNKEAEGRIFIGKALRSKPKLYVNWDWDHAPSFEDGTVLVLEIDSYGFDSFYCLHTNDEELRKTIGGNWQLEDLYGRDSGEATLLAERISKKLRKIVVATGPIVDNAKTPTSHSGLRTAIQLMEKKM